MLSFIAVKVRSEGISLVFIIFQLMKGWLYGKHGKHQKGCEDIFFVQFLEMPQHFSIFTS